MSSSNVGSHRRLIVELAHGATDARTLRAVAELAASLQLELHGLFIEDEDLLGLAELPFAREIRLPTHDWQKLEAGRVAAELQHAAGEAHRLLRSLAEALGIAIAFEVRRGDPGKMMAAVASGGDVIVLAAPAAP